MLELNERRKGDDRRQSRESAEPPYLTKGGWVSINRRKSPDRRRFDMSSLLEGEIEEIEIKA